MLNTKFILIFMFLIVASTNAQAKKHKELSIFLVNCTFQDQLIYINTSQSFLTFVGDTIKPITNSENSLDYKNLKFGKYKLQMESIIGDTITKWIEIDENTSNELIMCIESKLNQEISNKLDNFQNSDTLIINQTITTCMSGNYKISMLILKESDSLIMQIIDERLSGDELNNYSRCFLNSESMSILKYCLSDFYRLMEYSPSISNNTVVIEFDEIILYSLSNPAISNFNYYFNKLKKNCF